MDPGLWLYFYLSKELKDKALELGTIIFMIQNSQEDTSNPGISKMDSVSQAAVWNIGK